MNDDTLILSKLDNFNGEDDLLEDFGLNVEEQLEDPFKFGTEEIMKDILEDNVIQRSMSKMSTEQKRSSFLLDISNPYNDDVNQNISAKNKLEDAKDNSEVISSLDDLG